MKKGFKLIAICLIVAMLVTMIPIGIFAEEESNGAQNRNCEAIILGTDYIVGFGDSVGDGSDDVWFYDSKMSGPSINFEIKEDNTNYSSARMMPLLCANIVGQDQYTKNDDAEITLKSIELKEYKDGSLVEYTGTAFSLNPGSQQVKKLSNSAGLGQDVTLCYRKCEVGEVVVYATLDVEVNNHTYNDIHVFYTMKTKAVVNKNITGSTLASIQQQLNALVNTGNKDQVVIQLEGKEYTDNDGILIIPDGMTSHEGPRAIQIFGDFNASTILKGIVFKCSNSSYIDAVNFAGSNHQGTALSGDSSNNSVGPVYVEGCCFINYNIAVDSTNTFFALAYNNYLENNNTGVLLNMSNNQRLNLDIWQCNRYVNNGVAIDIKDMGRFKPYDFRICDSNFIGNTKDINAAYSGEYYFYKNFFADAQSTLRDVIKTEFNNAHVYCYPARAESVFDKDGYYQDSELILSQESQNVVLNTMASELTLDSSILPDKTIDIVDDQGSGATQIGTWAFETKKTSNNLMLEDESAEVESNKDSARFDLSLGKNRKDEDHLDITVTRDNDEALSSLDANLSIVVPDSWTDAKVMLNGEEIDSVLTNHSVTFNVTEGGKYSLVNTNGNNVYDDGIFFVKLPSYLREAVSVNVTNNSNKYDLEFTVNMNNLTDEILATWIDDANHNNEIGFEYGFNVDRNDYVLRWSGGRNATDHFNAMIEKGFDYVKDDCSQNRDEALCSLSAFIVNSKEYKTTITKSYFGGHVFDVACYDSEGIQTAVYYNDTTIEFDPADKEKIDINYINYGKIPGSRIYWVDNLTKGEYSYNESLGRIDYNCEGGATINSNYIDGMGCWVPLQVKAPKGYTLKNILTDGSAAFAGYKGGTNGIYTVQLFLGQNKTTNRIGISAMTFVWEDDSGEICERLELNCYNYDTGFEPTFTPATLSLDNDLSYSGMKFKYYPKTGCYKVTFDYTKAVSVSDLKTSMIIKAPEGAVYYQQNQASGGYFLTSHHADSKVRVVDNADIREVTDGQVSIPSIILDYYSLGEDKAYYNASQELMDYVINWLDKDQKLISRSFIYGRVDSYDNETTTKSVQTVNSIVKNPTLVSDANYHLICTELPQENGKNSGTKLFLLELAEVDNTAFNRTVYIPYSFIGVDGYSAIANPNSKPTIIHYNDDGTEKERLKGKYTPYGIEFTVTTFSPFSIVADSTNSLGTVSKDYNNAHLIIVNYKNGQYVSSQITNKDYRSGDSVIIPNLANGYKAILVDSEYRPITLAN